MTQPTTTTTNESKNPKIILGDMIYPPSICQAIRDLLIKEDK